MTFKIPPLPNAQLVDDRGYPTTIFQQYWQQLASGVEGALQTLATVQNVTLPSFTSAIASANAAAAAARAAAATANTAAAANTREQALVNSYIDPASVLTTTTTTITIAAHVRYYADGTHVSVSGGTVSATASGDVDFVSYLDPTRVGGAVTYVVSTDQPAQTGDTHVVGAIGIPMTGTATGGSGPRKPGFVTP